MVLSFIPKFEGKFDQLKNIGSANTGPSYLSETAPFFSSNYDHVLKNYPLFKPHMADWKIALFDDVFPIENEALKNQPFVGFFRFIWVCNSV